MADGRAGGAPPDVASAGGTDGALLDGGAFLLQLLQKPPQVPQRQTQPSDSHFDPAVAAFGPPLLPRDFLHHQPPPPGHFPDPILFPSPPESSPLRFSQAGAFGPSMWPAPQLPLPPGFLSIGGVGGGDLASHLHQQQQQQQQQHQQYPFLQFAQERRDLVLPGSSSIGDLGGNAGVGRDQALEASLRSGKLQDSGPPGGQEERKGGSMRPPPPGFRARVCRDADLDKGLVRWDGGIPRQDGRSAQMKVQNERPTVPIGQNHNHYQHHNSNNHHQRWQRQQNSLGDTGADLDSRQQWTGSEKPMLSGNTSAIKRSEQRSAAVERREVAHRFERKVEIHHVQKLDDEVLLDREIFFGDFQGKIGSFAGKLENQSLTVTSGLSVDHNLDSVGGNMIRDIKHDLYHEVAGDRKGYTVKKLEVLSQDDSDELSPEKNLSGDEDEVIDTMIKSLNIANVNEVKNAVAQGSSRSKDFRSDFSRGHHISSMRARIHRRTVQCRQDIDAFSPKFLSIFESLIPAEEEKEKQKQLLSNLGELVTKEWPSAKLFLYGSCGNSFGFSNSDIDLCLSIDDHDISKSEIILKLADILQSSNLQNVQALTRARVPIVKMMDPVTGLSCDICINNLLAVVNTKLLKDYAQIDQRLRQLAFIVKHWAKSRRVNETYQGTLSSYAYVLMCIHFLQQRRPAILPCLQAMETTYAVRVDDVDCAFYDQVEMLQAFGSRNRETIARLVWAFFHYWAYHHDYANDVVSVRTGGIISKRSKDWTRRVGNDRHLICIEDPFEVSHDLGRVVDKFSIKILREEFERAADILQYDHNPSVTLFQPYIREPPHM